MNPPQDYIRRVGELIAKANAAGVQCYRAQPDQKSENEALDTTRRVWAEILYPEIPLPDLENSVLSAIRGKKQVEPNPAYAYFPHRLSARDVLRAHREESQALIEKNRLQAISGPKKNCICGGTGLVKAYLPAEKRDVVKPCPFHGIGSTDKE